MMHDRMNQYEWSRDYGESSAGMRVGVVRDGAENNASVRELQTDTDRVQWA